MNRPVMLSRRPTSPEGGQVLVFFAIMLVVLLGMAALAIDVTSVLSLQRYERSVADAAALAGAQDLQVKGTRNVGTAQYTQARSDALRLLNSELGGTSSPSCSGSTASDIVDCAIPGTPYLVSIKTDPSPSAMTVDPYRAVQVTVRQPSVPLTFARLFNQRNWNVGITSVAGIAFNAQYAVITLRPPKPLKSGSDQNQNDVNIDGGTVVTIAHGDVGSNTNLVLSGSGSALKLDSGYLMYHYDTYQAWVGSPQGKVIPNPIPDPNYLVPSESAGSPPTFSNAAAAQDTAAGCTAAVATAITAGYAPPYVPFTLLANTNTICYRPGIYKFDIKNLSTTTATLLEPGVYFFDHGLTMYGTLIGGYQAGSPGVALVFTEGSQCTSGVPNKCYFAGNRSPLIALNAGACIITTSITCTNGAAPATGWDGSPVQVTFTGPGTVKSPVPESLIVTKDPNCTVASTESSTCADSENNDITLPGGGSLFVAGVQYAPTDNVKIAGSSGGAGRIGQIIAWTVFYTGGSQVSEFYPGGVGNGILRLDTACSGPGTVCNP